MASVIIKGTDKVQCSVDKEVGYTIRLLNYKGATFTIDLNGRLTVGQSSRMSYTLDDWFLLQQEIKIGMQYMSKVLTMKHWDGLDNIKQEFIKPKSYKNCTLYKDIKGRAILYITKDGTLHDGFGNRVGSKGISKVIYALFPNSNNILEVKRLSYDTIYVKIVDCSYSRVDSYTSKPNKILSELHNFGNFNIGDTINIIIEDGTGYQYTSRVTLNA